MFNPLATVPVSAETGLPVKFRALTGFEPMTGRYRCDALINLAIKPQKTELAE